MFPDAWMSKSNSFLIRSSLDKHCGYREFQKVFDDIAHFKNSAQHVSKRDVFVHYVFLELLAVNVSFQRIAGL